MPTTRPCRPLSLIAALALLAACRCDEPSGVTVRTAAPDGGGEAAADDAGAQPTLLEVALAAKAEGRLEDARRRLRLLAERGLPAAQHELGVMLEEGQGGPAEPLEAVRWLTLAADKDVPQAQLRLGLLHKAGRGVPQDDVKAWLWLSVAAAAGQEQEARPHLRELEARMPPATLRKARQMLPVIHRLTGQPTP